MTTIRPELLAAKLESARNGEPESASFAAQLAETPRLPEVLWMLQEMSRAPGGLLRFVNKVVEALPDRFQTDAMKRAGTPDKTGKWTLEQCLPVWLGETHRDERWDAQDLLGFELRETNTPPSNLDALGFDDWLAWFIGREVTAKDARGSSLQAQALRVGLLRFNLPFLKAECLNSATSSLPRLLADWCEQKGMVCRGVWYCPDLLQTLSDFMDHHAAQVARDLAETEVTRIVFRELDFARSQNVPVPIVGASRFGKTKAVSIWCAMRPGQARLVTVPDSSRERDFFAAHADAFGLQYNPSTTTAQLKRAVEYVHRHSGLFLVYDESHFLVPVSYHKATPPRRLNWVRCQVIDRGLGCAFFATPQSYRETLDAYVAKTGYRMEQWLGRMAPAVVLPESLPSEDVLAVARNHFPGVPEPFLKLIAARAMQSEGYLKNMELCVKRALFLAAEQGRRAPDLRDVEGAIAYIAPSAMPKEPEVITNAAPSRRLAAGPMRSSRSESASTLESTFEPDFSRSKPRVNSVELEPALSG